MSSHPNQITFGTDGFRGIISRDFTYDAVRRIAQGLADYIAYKNMRVAEKPSVFIGYDRRFMSDRFAAAVADVLTANGIVCVVSDAPLPTPAVSYLPTVSFAAFNVAQFINDEVVIVICLLILLFANAGNYLGLDTFIHFHAPVKKA